MDEASLREKIRQKLESGLIPRDRGAIVVGGNGGSRQLCGVCDEQIRPSDQTPISYDYVSGQRIWFHVQCHTLWDKERFTA